MQPPPKNTSQWNCGLPLDLHLKHLLAQHMTHATTSSCTWACSAVSTSPGSPNTLSQNQGPLSRPYCLSWFRNLRFLQSLQPVTTWPNSLGKGTSIACPKKRGLGGGGGGGGFFFCTASLSVSLSASLSVFASVCLCVCLSFFQYRSRSVCLSILLNFVLSIDT